MPGGSNPIRKWGCWSTNFRGCCRTRCGATGDRSLWALTSNGVAERSHVSPALERSVFGYFVAKGLKGAADANGDHVVDVNELYRYVRANVRRWVRTATAGHETQTPLLLWGGGADLVAR